MANTDMSMLKTLLDNKKRLDSGIIVDYGVEFKDNLGAINGV